MCGYHKSDILGSPVINFRARCKLAGCGKISSWGQGGKQLTHCPDHGPLEGIDERNGTRQGGTKLFSYQ